MKRNLIRIRKKLLCSAMSLVLLFGLRPAIVAAAKGVEPGIQILLDGTPLLFDVPPLVAEGRILVPFRVILEALGYTVAWDGRSGVLAWTPEHQITLTIGEAVMWVDGESRPLDVSPMVVESRTLIPLRAVAEASGCIVRWDQQRRTALLWREEALPTYFTYDSLNADECYLYTTQWVGPENFTVRVSLANLSAEIMPVHCISVQSYQGKLYGRFGFASHVYSYGVLDLDTYIGTDLTGGNVGACFVYDNRIYLGHLYRGFSSMALDGSNLTDLPGGWPGFQCTIRDGLIFGDDGLVTDLTTGEEVVRLYSPGFNDGREDFTWNGSADLRGEWYYVPFNGYLDEGHGLVPRGIAAWNYKTGEQCFYPLEHTVQDLRGAQDAILYITESSADGQGDLYRLPLSGGEAQLLQENVVDYELLVVGDYAYYWRHDLGICRCPVTGGPEELVYSSDLW